MMNARLITLTAALSLIAAGTAIQHVEAAPTPAPTATVAPSATPTPPPGVFESKGWKEFWERVGPVATPVLLGLLGWLGARIESLQQQAEQKLAAAEEVARTKAAELKQQAERELAAASEAARLEAAELKQQAEQELAAAAEAARVNAAALEQEKDVERKKKEDYRRLLIGPFVSEAPRHYTQKACRVMMLGDGGSGKTSIIWALTGHPAAEPNKRTGDSQAEGAHTYIYRVDHVQPEPCAIQQLEITDYRGQSSQNLAHRRMREAEQGVTPPVNVVVWVVDLVGPGEHGEVLSPRADIDSERVRIQSTDTWGDGAIAAWRGLTGGTESLWVLFINKADLIIGPKTEVEQRAKAAYNPLRQRLAAVSTGRGFEVIVGAADCGWGVPELARMLFARGVTRE